MSYTPGPWTWRYDGDEGVHQIDGPHLKHGVGKIATQADARLISAAPDLLEAAKLIQESEASRLRIDEALDALKSAVDKAEGK